MGTSVLLVLHVGSILRLVVGFGQESVTIRLHSHRYGHASSSLVAHVLSVSTIVLRVRHLVRSLSGLTLPLLQSFPHVLSATQVDVL